jgi:hypothetical protein
MSWLTTIYSYPIIITCKSILVILMLLTNFKVVTVIGTALNSNITL